MRHEGRVGMRHKHLLYRLSIQGARLAATALAVAALTRPVPSAAQAPAAQEAVAQAPVAQAPVTPPSVAPSAGAETPPPAPQRAAYVIGIDDQIVVRVADNAELGDKPQRVDQNGEIKLPMVGRVQAAGLTAQQLEAELINRYKVFLTEPDVAVSVSESRSQPVSIVGAVTTPGVKQLDGRKTLVEMLLQAGGVTADAGPTLTLTRRLERGRIPLPGAKDDPTGQFSTVDIELQPLVDGRAPANDVVLQPNDIISVSKADVVYVIGEVGHAGLLPLVRGNSISVLQAVSASGGVLRTAKPRESRILRPVPGQEARVEVPVDLDKIMRGKASDITLLAGDILVVPDNPGRRAAAKAVEVAIQSGITIATYGLIRPY